MVETDRRLDGWKAGRPKRREGFCSQQNDLCWLVDVRVWQSWQPSVCSHHAPGWCKQTLSMGTKLMRGFGWHAGYRYGLKVSPSHIAHYLQEKKHNDYIVETFENVFDQGINLLMTHERRLDRMCPSRDVMLSGKHASSVQVSECGHTAEPSSEKTSNPNGGPLCF